MPEEIQISLIEPEEVFEYFSLLQELAEHFTTIDQLKLSIPKLIKDEAKFVGVKENGTKIGFCLFYYSTKISNYKVCVIETLIVSKNHRSKGIGSKVMDLVEEQAIKDGCDAIELTSATFREDAHKFYFKNGFSIKSFGFSKALF
jgi:GNAT superfamily N-acetyltransferase